MLQRLAIALAQAYTGNTSKNVINEIHQITYSLYKAEEFTKKAYSNTKRSIKLKNIIATVF